jgi:hypothetical protein
MRQSENFMQADKTPSKDKELRHAQREREREREGILNTTNFEKFQYTSTLSTNWTQLCNCNVVH